MGITIVLLPSIIICLEFSLILTWFSASDGRSQFESPASKAFAIFIRCTPPYIIGTKMKAYMVLSSKVGAFNRVLDELLKLNLSKKHVFLLFGPFDILVQVGDLASVEEFIKKWFNPIRNITPKEPLIDKTQTFIVISEGKPFTEEPYAFLFLNTPPRYLEQVQEKLQAIPKVLSADTVFGPFDVICAVRASDREDLKMLVSRIQQEIPHIQGTVTAIVASIY
jgi:DNA-binding Lrp family transcriptional regulator